MINLDYLIRQDYYARGTIYHVPIEEIATISPQHSYLVSHYLKEEKLSLMWYFCDPYGGSCYDLGMMITNGWNLPDTNLDPIGWNLPDTNLDPINEIKIDMVNKDIIMLTDAIREDFRKKVGIMIGKENNIGY